MKFGVRECANIVFRAKTPTNIGKYKFKAGQPVLYIDTATTSSVEQATTTVYAQGGRGNVRLISWEGEKTLTFTVEDALLSPISLAMLSGADLFQGSQSVEKVHFHTTTAGATLRVANNKGTIDLSAFLGAEENICSTNDSPIYVIFTDGSGDLTGEMVISGTNTIQVKANGDGKYQIIEITQPKDDGLQSFVTSEYADAEGNIKDGDYAVFVDYYLDKVASQVDELQIAADNFAGNYYVEADTLFRRKSDGVDMPANLTFPNVKIQSNLTFSLSGTGDPSTFTFTMDALPGYTYFDKTREVLCVIQVIEDQSNADKEINPVMPHNTTLEHKKDEIDDARYIGYGDGTSSTGGNGSGSTDFYRIYGNDGIAAEASGIYSLVSSTLPGAVTWAIVDATTGETSTAATTSGGSVTGVTVTAGESAATVKLQAKVSDEVVAEKTITISVG